MSVAVGDSASLSRTITQADVVAFADLVGDRNPVHVDEAYARETRFGRTIAHGMWAASLISAAIGTRLPGPGTLYLGQTLRFMAPVFPGDTVTATVTVTAIREDKPIATLSTVCVNQDGTSVLEGEATVKLPG